LINLAETPTPAMLDAMISSITLKMEGK
ncbi:MAG: hypothetical protein RL748_185, partial [Pseudomonadota bacterium]